MATCVTLHLQFFGYDLDSLYTRDFTAWLNISLDSDFHTVREYDSIGVRGILSFVRTTLKPDNGVHILALYYKIFESWSWCFSSLGWVVEKWLERRGEVVI